MRLPGALIWHCWHNAVLVTGVSVCMCVMHEPAARHRDVERGWRPGGMACLMSDCLSLVGEIVFGICLTLGKCVCLFACGGVCERMQAALHNTPTAPSGSYPYACFALVTASE